LDGGPIGTSYFQISRPVSGARAATLVAVDTYMTPRTTIGVNSVPPVRLPRSADLPSL
jgi:hypothetical protein